MKNYESETFILDDNIDSWSPDILLPGAKGRIIVGDNVQNRS